VLPDIASMNADTCAALAQILPVLFIALLFEARARPSIQRSRAGIFLGFLGNLTIAIFAVYLELVVLGGLQNEKGVVGDATWVWFGSIALFGWVVLRWASTTAAVQIAAQLIPASAEIRAGFTRVMRDDSSGWQFFYQVLAAPSQAVVDVAQIAAALLIEVAKTSGGMLASIGAVLAGFFRSIAALLASGRR
jgi:hypothetical protein